MPLPSRITLNVVGVSFAIGYPQHLYDIERELMFYRTPTVRLVREPDNAVDPNAVRVVVFVEHPKPHYVNVGHVPAPLAQRLAPEMDAGEQWAGVVAEIRGSSEERPGITVTVARVQLNERSSEHVDEARQDDGHDEHDDPRDEQAQ